MAAKNDHTKDVPTQIKNQHLVEKRRRQIVDAAVALFIENGFHKTTTRQIAKAAGFSIGSLYEYVASKEDVLYLVCIAIHAEVERGVADAMARVSEGPEALVEVIQEYFMVCHWMSDHILLMYQVTQSLPPQWQKKVLSNEIRITNVFKEVISRIVKAGHLSHLSAHNIDLIAHNISVLGQQWAFRRWHLARHYTIEEYIRFQTDFILGAK